MTTEVLLSSLGVLGIGISYGAYLPQVVHLAREHCSAGVSTRSWAMWLVGGLLVGLVALDRQDPVFIVLQLNNLLSAAVILFLARRYRGMACSGHGSGFSKPEALATIPRELG